MKRSKLLVLSLSLLFSLCALPLGTGAVTIDSPATYAADILYQLGLFHGVGKSANGSPDFDLLGTPSREVAVTMLVRLLGKDEAAQRGIWHTPFSDVSDWAKPYVGYAYENKLTLGTTDSTFGGSDPVTAAQYLTFVLRALGYSSDEDFSWSAAWDLSDALGITYGEYDTESINFNRGDVAIISAAALGAPMKDSDRNLLMFLKSSGVLAPNKLVLMELKTVSCQKNTMGFAFYPLPGSPNDYASFTLKSVTANGHPCKITQYPSNQDAIAALPALKETHPNLFNYSILSYDEAAVKDSAEHFTDLGGGNVFPVIVFAFETVGTLPNGSEVRESFSEAVYIDGYGDITKQ